jgi:hypothetical protein
MERVAHEAARENWNGYGARRLSPEAYEMATRFALLLPVTVPNPEPAADADGDFSFEWYRGPLRVFSVSVNSNGTVHYAGLFGRSNTHGAEILTDTVPEAIALGLARVLGEASAM